MYKLKIKWLDGSCGAQYFDKITDYKLDVKNKKFFISSKKCKGEYDFNTDHVFNLINISIPQKTIDVIEYISVVDIGNGLEFEYTIDEKEKEPFEKIQEFGVEKFFDAKNNITLQIGNIFSDIAKRLDYWIEVAKKEQDKKENK